MKIKPIDVFQVDLPYPETEGGNSFLCSPPQFPEVRGGLCAS